MCAICRSVDDFEHLIVLEVSAIINTGQQSISQRCWYFGSFCTIKILYLSICHAFLRLLRAIDDLKCEQLARQCTIAGA